MQPTVRVLHLRSADPVRAAQLDAWLARHASPTTGFADAFDLAAHVLTHYADPPDLIFVAADALQPSEQSLPLHIRETWPGVPLVFYGSDRDAARCEASFTLGVFGDAAMDALFAQSPVRVSARIRDEFECTEGMAPSGNYLAARSEPSADQGEPELKPILNQSDLLQLPESHAAALVPSLESALSVELSAPERQNGGFEPRLATAPGGDDWRIPAGDHLTPEEIEALLDDGAG